MFNLTLKKVQKIFFIAMVRPDIVPDEDVINLRMEPHEVSDKRGVRNGKAYKWKFH
ncbi:hypothetical protein QFZ80_000127 [Paenibacillus sp. V4I7]|nr:hypothetical protein [Paenibacillus sp. V4I7]MDQ0913773.1 hypothetical protein [Paenibacillus sp. V4I5]